ncbi:MAG: iron-sulfur binding hydrogenase [Fervidobacterium sp.]|nr:iron-sulfur binding hydrogenase [Fervidobacterium sp.]
MTLSKIIESLGLKVVYFCYDYEIEHGYVGDLLSIVMRSAQQNSVWLTVQSHVNIIAVAALTGTKAIILCEGLEFPEETIHKAREENINLLISNENSYITAGRIYELGIR